MQRKMNRNKWVWPLGLAIAGLAVHGGLVGATKATDPGFAGTTLATATFGPIDSHVVSANPQWEEMITTHGNSDLYVQQNDWDPGACNGCVPSSGWHTHPGPSLVIVTKGSVTEYDGDDPNCTPHVYTADTPNNSFIDIGGGQVHIVRDESGAPAQTIAVQLIPAGADRRQDVATSPGNCPF